MEENIEIFATRLINKIAKFVLKINNTLLGK